MPTVCIFCGSRNGAAPAYTAAARAVGHAIGERGWQLVYGGGKVGLMGVLADAAIESGARVTGIIPESLMQREVGHRGLHELLVVPTMHLRKQAMAERADAFIALPGGLGTFEELFEVWTWRQLGYHDRPLGLLNTEGYFDRLLGFLEQTVAEQFVSAPQWELLTVEAQPAALLDRVALAMQGASKRVDLRRA
ncbi:MAG: TIGR00730 family Rossman fold protein [Microbacteriaceae bacterium]|nr:TIGR00730 family Rossman fold protein [Microbacteriaceae bacterium]